MKGFSSKKRKWKNMRKLRIQVLLCFLLCGGNVVYADGASDNGVKARNDKYVIGTSTSVESYTAEAEIPNSINQIIGGLVSNNSTNNIIAGGKANLGNASNNAVFIQGVTNKDIYGALIEVSGAGNANANTVKIERGSINSAYGAYVESDGNADRNEITIIGESWNDENTVVSGNVYGGYTKGNGSASSNTVLANGRYKISSGGYHYTPDAVFNGDIYGGYAMGNGIVDSNDIAAAGNITGSIYGGYSNGSGDVTYNRVEVTQGYIQDNKDDSYKYYGSVTGNIYGGYTTGIGDSNSNSVTIRTNVYGDIYGGYSLRDGNSNRNSVNISGYTPITVTGNIYGGYSSANGSANDNFVSISNGCNLGSSNVYGGYSASGNIKGNVLNVYDKDNKTKSINNFQYLRFYLTGINYAVKNNETMLTTETANIQGAKITGYIDGDTDLTDGDKVTLIDAQTLNTDANTTYEGTVAEGISFNHKLNVARDGNKIVATVGESSDEPTGGDNTGGGTTILEQTDILPTPAVIAPKMFVNHLENTLDWLPDKWSDGKTKELGMDVQAEKPGYEIFANVGASNIRTNTGAGSHVDSKTNGLNLGFARRFDSENGARTYIAPLFDFGGGSYDSYLGNGIHGKGHTHFTTGGFIARRALNNGVYFESSLRIGKTTMDFATDDLAQGDTYPHVAYDTSARIWAAHLNFGRKLNVSPNDVLNVYGIYFHTHQGAMDAKLTTGETYRFDSVTNQRLRVGARLTKWAKPTSCFYSGIAYQWESAGAANATYKGQSTNNIGAAGSSLMVELGWQVKPQQDSRVALDIGAVGWLGHQRGASAHVKFNYAF